MLTRTPDTRIGILALVPDAWGLAWQPRHHVLARLAERFPVAWVEPIGEWREPWADATKAPDGLDVQEAPRFGFAVPRFLSSAVQSARLSSARRALLQRGCNKILLYLWRPQYADALDQVAHDASLYHIDDDYQFGDDQWALRAQEEALMRDADACIIHSRRLWERKAQHAQQAHEVPNGVDFEAFAAPLPEPTEYASIPRPRLGYVGYLKTQLDWALLERLALRHPAWSFVYVGAARPQEGLQDTLSRIGKLPNVHFIGGRPAAALPPYMQHLDIGMLPYAISEYTNCIYPTKLHEYLAAGIRVVGSPIQTLRHFPDVVRLANGEEAWSATLSQVLASGDTQRDRSRRLAVARAHDWNGIAGRIGDIVESLVMRSAMLVPLAVPDLERIAG